jgi:hypothetical protein
MVPRFVDRNSVIVRQAVCPIDEVTCIDVPQDVRVFCGPNRRAAQCFNWRCGLSDNDPSGSSARSSRRCHSAFWRSAHESTLSLHAAHGLTRGRKCEGCTSVTSQVVELSTPHSRDITFAVFANGPMTRASAPTTSWAGRCRGTQPRTPSTRCSCTTCGTKMACSRPTGRQPEVRRQWTTATSRWTSPCMGRQEAWEDSPPGWRQQGHLTQTDTGPAD